MIEYLGDAGYFMNQMSVYVGHKTALAVWDTAFRMILDIRPTAFMETIVERLGIFLMPSLHNPDAFVITEMASLGGGWIRMLRAPVPRDLALERVVNINHPIGPPPVAAIPFFHLRLGADEQPPPEHLDPENWRARVEDHDPYPPFHPQQPPQPLQPPPGPNDNEFRYYHHRESHFIALKFDLIFYSANNRGSFRRQPPVLRGG
jgi:hypothetical protein